MEIADVEAIRVFADNLRELLLASPLGSRNVLAIDPGFRTGCKIVCLDRQGKLLHHDVLFPTTGEGLRADAALKVVFGGKGKVSMFEMTKLVSNHVS